MKINNAILPMMGLIVLGLFIWVRDLAWMSGSADVLPVLAAFPLFLWLAFPWDLKEEPAFTWNWRLPVAAGLFVSGVVCDMTFPMALGWVILLQQFLSAYLEDFDKRITVLPLFGFPWVVQDFHSIGWLFRHAGAKCVAYLFTLGGAHVFREGTLLTVNGMPLSIDPACGGLNVLQAMLVVGCFLICLRARRGSYFWAAIALLAPLAWLANTLRIFALGCAGLAFGPGFAMGWFHEWGGWLVVCVMFFLSQLLLSLIPRSVGTEASL